MATLASLEEKKRELEDKLDAGDLSVEPALARIDAAIVARTQKIQHSQKRLSAVKEAVRAGVPVADTRKPKSQAAVKKSARARRPINRFD
jgi:Arc/MetJ family transcription regulator